jgi:hypothetical protein
MEDRTDEMENPDSLLDSALESYTPRDARVGLESRILAAAAASERTRSRNWKPIWALAAAAFVLALAPISLRFRSIQQSKGPAIAVAERRPASTSGAGPFVRLPAASGVSLARRAAAERPAAGGLVRATTPIHASPSAAATNQASLREPIEFNPIVIAPIRIETVN